MAHTQYTLALDSENWDLQVGANGSLKTLKKDDAILQNVCNECRCFTDDLYFETQRGIPWFNDQLGQKLSPAVTQSDLRRAATSVEGVQSVDDVNLTFMSQEDRTLHAEITLTTENGLNGSVGI